MKSVALGGGTLGMVTDMGDDGNEIDAPSGLGGFPLTVAPKTDAIVARDRFPSAAISRGNNRHFMV